MIVMSHANVICIHQNQMTRQLMSDCPSFISIASAVDLPGSAA